MMVLNSRVVGLEFVSMALAQKVLWGLQLSNGPPPKSTRCRVELRVGYWVPEFMDAGSRLKRFRFVRSVLETVGLLHRRILATSEPSRRTRTSVVLGSENDK